MTAAVEKPRIGIEELRSKWRSIKGTRSLFGGTTEEECEAYARACRLSIEARLEEVLHLAGGATPASDSVSEMTTEMLKEIDLLQSVALFALELSTDSAAVSKPPP